MGRTSRVDQIPMLLDVDPSVTQQMELSRFDSNQGLVVLIDGEEEDTVPELHGGTTPTAVGFKGDVEYHEDKHEHLLRSGPMGKCDDPYCSTCPSYFGYAKDPAIYPKVTKNVFLGRTTNLRKRAAFWSQRWVPPILHPHKKIVQQWNKIFCISSLIAVFIDPLFFFLFSVETDPPCLVFDNSSALSVTIFRTLTDTVHFMHILLQFRLAYVGSASKVRNAGELEDDPKKIAVHYLKGWFVLDLFTALPLPQLLIWTVVRSRVKKESGANYAKNTLRIVVLLQNIPRGLRFFPLLIGRSPSGFVFETAWSNFVINMLMYLLAGHIVGACWYLFGLQRVNKCLERACKRAAAAAAAAGTVGCSLSYLDCGAGNNPKSADASYQSWASNNAVNMSCLDTNNIDSSIIRYGIYETGVQVVLDKNIVVKYVYSVFWGFQNISTLAGNLVPSTFVWEVLFTMGIVALGLLLFALLIGNMQNFLQALGRRKLDMQLRRYDTEVWMKQRRLPVSLRKRVRQAGRHRWVATGGVEEAEMYSDLPEDLQRDIQRYLCLELIKKVRLFELLEDHVLDAICERLYQKLYIESSEVLRVKTPVERMLFIVRGKMQSEGEDGSRQILKEGDFCGDELLSWYIDVAGVSTSKKKGDKYRGKHPVSSRTVKCLSSVEVFALDSHGLEYITNHYKSAFKSPRVQGAIRYLSAYWRSLAAGRIQKSWRAHKARTSGGSAASGSSQKRKFSRFGTINDRDHLHQN